MWLSLNLVDDHDTPWRVQYERVESYGPLYSGKFDGPAVIRTYSGEYKRVKQTMDELGKALEECRVTVRQNPQA